MNVCPTAAIRIKQGKATLNENACTDCGMCLKSCPQQATIVEQDVQPNIQVFLPLIFAPDRTDWSIRRRYY